MQVANFLFTTLRIAARQVIYYSCQHFRKLRGQKESRSMWIWSEWSYRRWAGFCTLNCVFPLRVAFSHRILSGKFIPVLQRRSASLCIQLFALWSLVWLLGVDRIHPTDVPPSLSSRSLHKCIPVHIRDTPNAAIEFLNCFPIFAGFLSSAASGGFLSSPPRRPFEINACARVYLFMRHSAY